MNCASLQMAHTLQSRVLVHRAVRRAEQYWLDRVVTFASPVLDTISTLVYLTVLHEIPLVIIVQHVRVCPILVRTLQAHLGALAYRTGMILAVLAKRCVIAGVPVGERI